MIILLLFQISNRIIADMTEIILKSTGDKEWRLKGRLHREDGPAIERANGQNEWWVNGELQGKMD